MNPSLPTLAGMATSLVVGGERDCEPAPLEDQGQISQMDVGLDQVDLLADDPEAVGRAAQDEAGPPRDQPEVGPAGLGHHEGAPDPQLVVGVAGPELEVRDGP